MPSPRSSTSATADRSSSTVRRRVLLGLVLPLLAVSAAACGTSSTTGTGTAAPGLAVTSIDANGQIAPAPHQSFAAQITHASTQVHADATRTSTIVSTLGPTTALGSKTTVLVLDQRDGWVHVSLPTRPNGSTGWIESDDVALQANAMAITVDRASHQLTLTRDGDVVLTTPVAVGSPTNPTPAGAFYTTDLVDPGAPNGAYGPFAFGLSGHSDTLTEFAGGDAQLGLHGTDDPSSIGQSVSHGCIRVPNDVVRRLATLVPLGTPVTVG